jgi:hypothetical protein
LLADWLETFERIAQSPYVTIEHPPVGSPGTREAWVSCYRRMREAANHQAELLDEKVPAVAFTTGVRRPDPERFIDAAFDDWERNETTAPEILS